MIREQDAVRLREIYVRTGRNVSQTAREYGCARDTVRRVLARDYSIDGGITHRHHAHPEDQAISDILGRNAQAEERSHKMRLTSTRIAHLIQADGCTLSTRQIMRRVAIVRAQRREVRPDQSYLALSAPPGHWQADFGAYEAIIGGTRVKLSCLVMTSAYSGSIVAEAVPGEDTACFFSGMEACFGQIGGVPPVIRLDNLSPAVLWRGHDRQKTEAFSRFEAHHGFRAEFCRPSCGWEKGSVERAVRYLRENFFCPLHRCEYASMDALNASLRAFCRSCLSQMHYSQKIEKRALLDAERAEFLQYVGSMGYAEQRIVAVDKRGYVVYRGNRYYTCTGYGLRHAVVRATAQTVEIRSPVNGEIVSAHGRLYGRRGVSQAVGDLAEILAVKPRAIPYVIPGISDDGAIMETIRSMRKPDRADVITALLLSASQKEK